MKLLIVRHGEAGDRNEFAATGQPDELRPLTKEGARDFARVVRGLRRVVKRIDVLATSPLVRARQTAEILAEPYEASIEETDALKPDAPFTAFVSWIKRSKGSELVAVVGHDPHLSGLAARLIGDTGARIALKKGGACLIEFDRAPQRGAGTLLWLVPPRMAQRLQRK